MRIYIVGPVGSGKTTFAKELSQITGINYYELDLVRYYAQNSSLKGFKRPDEERNTIFAGILAQDDWIIEDVGRECFELGLQNADEIILIDLNTMVIVFRILKRWLGQRLGMEKAEYNPSLSVLLKMYRWLYNYKNGNNGIKKRLSHYLYKTQRIVDNKSRKACLESYRLVE